ncbi:hypothetical protein MMC08_003782 [Hypocenomyce scalaris]|nr:hypothetical protein [Hypocenomyce scalaris]
MLPLSTYISALPLTIITAVLPLATSAQSINGTALSSCAASVNSALPSPVPADFTFSGNVRQYYIAAEEIDWNFIPTGWDNWLGVPINDSPRAYSAGYTTAAGSLGLTWKKAVYRQYTDASFTTPSSRPSFQGILGPTLRAEVGDMIEILFFNNLTANYASMHSMGLAYSQANEGSLYPHITANQGILVPSGSAIAPGGCYVYKWLVDSASAPNQDDVSKMWAYHSYVSMDNDLNAGLMGPTFVYASGMMNVSIASAREFPLIYMDYNESNSFMSSINAAKFNVSTQSSGGPQPMLGNGYGNFSIWNPQLTNYNSSSALTTTQAPLFHTLNGGAFANNAPFEMCVNEKAIWYVMALGSASHTFHMHGNSFQRFGQNMASIGLNDGTMVTLTANMTGAGGWQLICHADELENLDKREA